MFQLDGQKTDTCPTTDTQIIDKEISKKSINTNFEVKTFALCSDMKKVIKDYVKNNYNFFLIIIIDEVL